MITDQARKLGEGLVAARILTQDQLNKAIAEASMDNAPSLIVNLLEQDLLTYQIFEKFITKSLGIKSAIISGRKFDPQLIKKLGENVIKSRHIFPMGVKEVEGKPSLFLAMVDPLDSDVIEMVERITKLKVMPVLISLPDFNQTVQNLFTPAHGVAVSSRAEAEKLVLIRPGGYEEEIAFQAGKTATVQHLSAKKLSTDAGVDHFPGAESGKTQSSLLGTSAKKYREEIIVKLDLKGSDAKALKKELYTKEIFYSEIAEINPKTLELAYTKLNVESKVEALANTLIKLGIIKKSDLMMAGAVSAVFGESENK
jgi:hypothetical protein